MADFENTINFDMMDDSEVRDLIRQRLDEDDDFDVDAVDVHVRDGAVRIEGRVGTEEERQHVEQVLTSFGAERVENNVVVDESARAQRSDAADIARLEDAAVTDELGESGKATSDTAEHLHADTKGDQHGTHDMGKAIERGQSYNPPDTPPQQGTGGGELH